MSSTSLGDEKMENVAYRGPKKGDAKGLLAFINELAAEDTFIKMERQTLAKERKWLGGRLADIRGRNSAMVVAEAGGKIVGNCGISRRAVYKRVRHVAIFGISVLKGYRGRGIGEELARRAISEARRRMGVKMLTLTVMANNPVAQKLYGKLGFKKCGVCPRAFWYRGKYVDEIMMYRWI